ncbi:hypothetical protein [Pectinatus frisingensis]|uniref:hypothetical protein n=1 Tax=Pectinatus frisingensis TaxID=865 RepID=UPI0018C70327|nr:hypothetical protein [Pectinatus frisingensis]
MERISNSQLEILINCGINQLDRSRTISALRELKEHREDQPKYEKTIDDMAAEIADYAEIGVYCDGCQYFEDENEDCLVTSPVECRAHIVKYYKQRAGIKGEE